MIKHRLLVASLSAMALYAFADHRDLAEVIVLGEQSELNLSHARNNQQQLPDSASVLAKIPGAEVNRNGPITGIAQYRGAYGDQINIVIDGAHYVGGGPNAMDTPLSYIPGGLLKEISVSRGIASVSAGQETLGGHISAVSYQGEFGKTDHLELFGMISSAYASNNKGNTTSALVYAANNSYKLGARLSYDHGEDAEFDNNKDIKNSFYQRNRYDVLYGYQSDKSGVELSVGRSETDDAGTPALPMDIINIDTDLAHLHAYTLFGNTRLEARLSYNYVDHGMNNLTHRRPPNAAGSGMPINRITRATGRNLVYHIELQSAAVGGKLTLGIDQSSTIHDADITDPSNAMFLINNFNNADRNIAGVYTEWTTTSDPWRVEVGLRRNRITMNSDRVNASGMMGMMATNATALANRFNNAKRRQTANNTDAVVKASYLLTLQTTLGVGLAQKQRAPSYIQRYLWLPLQSTGGLADGHNYIGNPDLESESAREINIGIDWLEQRAYMSAQVFYRRVDDYIQGTPSTNMQANMISTMMSGKAALQFNNVEAKLYGSDLSYGIAIGAAWRIDGSLSYVRGERTDKDDDLYRIAPLNHRLSANFNGDNYKLALESVLYTKQSHTSAFNHEEKTSGYGLIHVHGSWSLHDGLTLSAGIDNVLNKTYQNHLSGINRVADSDISQGEHLFGSGRGVYIGASYTW